jgi:hypothetical protein
VFQSQKVKGSGKRFQVALQAINIIEMASSSRDHLLG